VGCDRVVVRVLVDQGQPADLVDPLAVRLEELAELLRGLDEEVGPLQGGVARDLAEQVVAASVHRIASLPLSLRGVLARLVVGRGSAAEDAHRSTRGIRDRVPSARGGTWSDAA